MKNFLEQAHPEWRDILHRALDEMDAKYLQELETSNDWLPGKNAIFAAFSIPLSTTKFILLGESPYPRNASANGYAFWDKAVSELWSVKGLSKEVNRATSLRNWLKMLLFARGDLNSDLTQEAISQLDKTAYVKTADELFNALLSHGFLLLNASLVFSKGKVNYHARHWRPFIHSVLTQIASLNSSLQLILFGRIAQQIPEANAFISLKAEHPYNISFITNAQVVEFFKPLDLLRRYEN